MTHWHAMSFTLVTFSLVNQLPSPSPPTRNLERPATISTILCSLRDILVGTQSHVTVRKFKNQGIGKQRPPGAGGNCLRVNWTQALAERVEGFSDIYFQWSLADTILTRVRLDGSIPLCTHQYVCRISRMQPQLHRYQSRDSPRTKAWPCRIWLGHADSDCTAWHYTDQ